MFEINSDHWCNKIIFRDYLLKHPETVKEYEKLKIALALEHKLDREKYTDEKAEFVKKVLAKASKVN